MTCRYCGARCAVFGTPRQSRRYACDNRTCSAYGMLFVGNLQNHLAAIDDKQARARRFNSDAPKLSRQVYNVDRIYRKADW
jgi:hypothetical protein